MKCASHAAAGAFGRTGHVHTSMADIAAAAGITKRIVYRHFATGTEAARSGAY